MEKQEQQRQRIAFFTSVGVHLTILLLFLFSMAWRAPDPPLPEFGIELNFGDSPVGSGDVQPETPTAAEQQQEDDPVEAEPEQVESQPDVVPSKQESPVAEPTQEKPKEIEQPKPEEKKVEPKSAQATETTGNQPQSQGDDKSKTGDKGDPKGTPDPNAEYTGKPGGGGGGDGMNLQMAGWAWAERLVIPDLPENDFGKVIFKIECDEDGEILGVTTEEITLSPRAEQLLKDMIRKNSLNRTAGGQTPTRSTGYFTFTVRPK